MHYTYKYNILNVYFLYLVNLKCSNSVIRYNILVNFQPYAYMVFIVLAICYTYT